MDQFSSSALFGFKIHSRNMIVEKTPIRTSSVKLAWNENAEFLKKPNSITDYKIRGIK